LFPRHGEHIRAGPAKHPDGLGRSHVVVKSIEDIDTSQLVAISLEDSLDGQPTNGLGREGFFATTPAQDHCIQRRSSTNTKKS
jgi:hypothetical protein